MICCWRELGYYLFATVYHTAHSYEESLLATLMCFRFALQFSFGAKYSKQKKRELTFFSPSLRPKIPRDQVTRDNQGEQLPEIQSIHHTLDFIFSPFFTFLRASLHTTHNHANGHTIIGSPPGGEVKLQRSRILGLWEHRNDRCLFLVDGALLRPTDVCESFCNSLLGLGWL